VAMETELKEFDVRRPSNTTTTTSKWPVLGKRLPRQEIIFFAQVFIIYIVIIACIVNLTLYPKSDDGKLWTALLSCCLGYLLPNPSQNQYFKQQQQQSSHVIR